MADGSFSRCVYVLIAVAYIGSVLFRTSAYTGAKQASRVPYCKGTTIHRTMRFYQFRSFESDMYSRMQSTRGLVVHMNVLKPKSI